MLIAQIDDEELFQWLHNVQLLHADERGGRFLAYLAKAALLADSDNYPLLHPVLQVIRAKYPEYNRRLCHGCGHTHESKICGKDMGGAGKCQCDVEVAA